MTKDQMLDYLLDSPQADYYVHLDLQPEEKEELLIEVSKSDNKLVGYVVFYEGGKVTMEGGEGCTGAYLEVSWIKNLIHPSEEEIFLLYSHPVGATIHALLTDATQTLLYKYS